MRLSLTFLFTYLLILSDPVFSTPRGIKHYEQAIPAPEFLLSDLNAKTHTLSDYRGQVLIVSFWATWCTPCVKELPSLERAAELLREDDVHILTINVGESAERIQRFVSRHPVNLPLLPDPKSDTSTAWRVNALPTAYVVNKQGMIVIRVSGGIVWDDDEIIRAIQRHTR